MTNSPNSARLTARVLRSLIDLLLLLRDKVGAENKSVSLANCKGNVRQVLDIANFGKLFKIS